MSTLIPKSALVASNLLRFGNFSEILRYRSRTQGDKRIFTFLEDGEGMESPLTYGELYRDSLAVAQFLEERTLPGDRVLLLFPTNLDFIRAFLGTVIANRVAVPLVPPDPSRLAQSLPQFLKIAQDARSNFLLTDERLLGLAKPLLDAVPGLTGLQQESIAAALSNAGKDFESPKVEDSNPALLLYTSGSTGDAKGVLVSHQNLINMTGQLHRHFHFQGSDTLVSWLPFYHNFGLVTSILDPLFFDTPCVFLSPLAFLQRPVRWLRAISRYRAAVSAGSNFSYELCAKQVTEEEKQELDLSGWRFAVCGSEPVRTQTLQRFSFHFRSCGFTPEAFFPGYGLSEATSVVSARHRFDRLRSLSLSQRGLQKNLVAEPGSPEDRLEFYSCGRPLPSLDLRIVNPQTRSLCPRGQVGEIWVKGPSIAMGYWQHRLDTQESFRAYLAGSGEGPYLRTGDLGFNSAGELFITGRLKELIIVRGQNHYPSDIERTVSGVDVALKGDGMAFSVEQDSEEQLVLVQEIEGEGSGSEDIFEKIQQAVSKTHGLQVWEIALVPAGILPRTRLGKLQRNSCKQAFLKGELPILSRWRRASFGSPVGTEPPPVPRRAEEIRPWIISLIGKLFQIPAQEINLNRPLTDHGLDSLRSVQLTQSIERDLRIVLPVSQLFEASSLASLIQGLVAEFSKPEGTREKPREALVEEARLDPAIGFSKDDSLFSDSPSNVLLTGATGFLGAYLLEELLKKTRARVYCLVRARHLLEGLERIRKNLEFFSLWKEEFLTRIQPVLGDLSRERVGLNEKEFLKLAESVDSIFHNGASVNFIYSYRDLKAANVHGTQEILRLASTAKTKPVFYVSTLSVFPTAGDPGGRLFTENDFLEQPEGLLNGYAQSKWVAERLLLQAKDRGLPAMIFRVGEVIGHSRSGLCRAERDAYSVLMRGAIELQFYPRMELLFYFVPVDYACQAMVHLSLRKENLGKAFHLTNPQAIHVADLFRVIEELGFPCQGVPLPQWLEKIIRLSEQGKRCSLASFVPFLQSQTIQALADSRTLLKIDCQRTLAALGELSHRCPPPGKTLFQPYLHYLKASGFLPKGGGPDE